jgi:hypothetical protein
MKFVGILKWTEVTDTFLKKVEESQAIRKKTPDRFPKKLRLEDGSIAQFNLLAGGQKKGIIIYDTDDPEQLFNLARFWMPEITITFIPARQPSE